MSMNGRETFDILLGIHKELGGLAKGQSLLEQRVSALEDREPEEGSKWRLFTPREMFTLGLLAAASLGGILDAATAKQAVLSLLGAG